MGTFTAQILVGHSHPYHGGINPSHILFLSENGRSAWCLYPSLSHASHNVDPSDFRVWICDPYTLLEDAMVIIVLFAIKNESFIKFAEKMEKQLLSEKRFEFIDIPLEKRQLFYNETLSIDWNGLKLAISIFGESSIRNITQLENYKNLEFEVCVSLYEKRYNVFSQRFETRDKLKIYKLTHYLELLKGENDENLL